MSSTLFLSIYNISIVVHSESTAIVEWLSFDFASFITEADPHRGDVSVSVKISDSKLYPVPGIPESDHSPEFVRYSRYGIQYIDYYGQVLVVYDESKESGQFIGTELEILYEKLYLFIMSRVGEMLDYKSLHRVHAFGASYEGKGILYLIPERGGKSTLALNVSREPGFKILSDDTPLLNSAGGILPFPFRVAVRSGEEPSGVHSNLIREFVRSKRGNKTLLHPHFFKDAWEKSEVPCSLVFIGKWTRANEPSYRVVSRFSVWRTLFRDCVIGLGLPQVVEYFLKATLKDIFNKMFLVGSRIFAISRIAARAQGFELHVTSDTKKNIELFMRVVREHGKGTL